MSTTARRRTTATIAASALVGGVLGIGGTSLALWSDTVRVTGAVIVGHEYFAVGGPGSTVAASAGVVTFTVGADEAARLLDAGTVAVPIQVDTLSEGNKGLRYEIVTPASWGTGVFASSEMVFFPVEDHAGCSVDIPPPVGASVAERYVSTPVSSEHADADRTEYWCLHAHFVEPPKLGDYTNTATVTAQPPEGDRIGADSSWSAGVLADLVPANEPDHTFTFSYETFRPQGEP